MDAGKTDEDLQKEEEERYFKACEEAELKGEPKPKEPR